MYAIVDIETTGGSAADGAITEIAIILHNGIEVEGSFHTLINPEQRIPYFITRLTGITNEMVTRAPRFMNVAENVYNLLAGRIFVAHNVTFDYSFVKQHLKRCGFSLNTQKLCTVKLARKVLPGYPSYSLGKICNSLNIKIEGRHRAYGDATATTILFEKLLREGGHSLKSLL